MGSGTGLCGLVSWLLPGRFMSREYSTEQTRRDCSIRSIGLGSIGRTSGACFQTIIGYDIVYELFHATQVLQQVLRVHIGRSNGGVVKPSLLFECLAFALSENKERNQQTAHTERERRLTSSDLEYGLPHI
ncbi:hypothetical protein PROFUN_03344 [Planoprotostelium fungivorum]|uniref:Uncharacterized protein n=1 Tax=Planoprotostelium fungivorum TaxID=1890364 RepID=A0A2P6NW93_9EUKA|nr:hypothetical protein PROFUN_03344 [Planoprotostelium fungivorum]